MEEQVKNINENEVVNKEENIKPKKEKIKKTRKKIDAEKDALIKANLELKEKVLRITADMQNMRRRFDQDLTNAYKYDGFELVEKLLPVIDNFERAMSIKTEGSEKFLEGFKMIYDNLISILAQKGIKEIEALDKEFDANVMNAVMTEENQDKDNNIVLEVLQKGYMLKDKMIRPALVKVSE